MRLTKPKEFTVHDAVYQCEKKGERYRYSLGFYSDKRLSPKQVKGALDALKSMVMDKL